MDRHFIVEGRSYARREDLPDPMAGTYSFYHCRFAPDLDTSSLEAVSMFVNCQFSKPAPSAGLVPSASTTDEIAGIGEHRYEATKSKVHGEIHV